MNGKITYYIMSLLLMTALFASAPLSAAAQVDDAWHETRQQRKEQTDRTFEQLSSGVLDYQKVTYQSREGYLDIPAYIFAPLEKRGRHGHAALIWIHGGVHGDLSNNYFPFIKEAVEQGYVVIAPEYRGSTGYGKEHYDNIDYGGYEVEDCITAVDYMQSRMPYVDPERMAMIGWSHGGFITVHALERQPGLFMCGVAIVPVTNLVQRLSYKGPRYQSNFVKQYRIGGNTWERRSIYIERSPVYHVDKIQDPILVHITRNDRDVNFEEAEMMVNALNYKKPFLAETKIYDDPRGGHAFNRQVNTETWERDDTPEQRDSWNRIWQFLEWNLRPYEDRSKK
ncbi:alpha/beta hydrolase family protein [candidate division KSB1 bacterium]